MLFDVDPEVTNIESYDAAEERFPAMVGLTAYTYSNFADEEAAR